jgi:peptide/nickel transport system permease protein
MTSVSDLTVNPLEATDDLAESPRRSIWMTLIMTAEGRIGLAGALVVGFIVIFGPVLAPYPPDELQTGIPLTGPTHSHLLGTDTLGRDVLSRFLHGGTFVVLVPFCAVVIAFLVGGGLGMLAAYTGGIIDSLVSRVFDLALAMPPLLIALVLIAGAGTGKLVVILVVALVFFPRVGRVVRGAVQGVVVNDYVAAAHARGERAIAIILREIVPNAAPALLAEFALRITYGVLFVAALNFLGLGIQPPNPDWGVMIAEAKGIMALNPWALFVPAAGIATLSIASNLIADAFTHHITGDAESGVRL